MIKPSITMERFFDSCVIYTLFVFVFHTILLNTCTRFVWKDTLAMHIPKLKFFFVALLYFMWFNLLWLIKGNNASRKPESREWKQLELSLNCLSLTMKRKPTFLTSNLYEFWVHRKNRCSCSACRRYNAVNVKLAQLIEFCTVFQLQI